MPPGGIIRPLNVYGPGTLALQIGPAAQFSVRRLNSATGAKSVLGVSLPVTSYFRVDREPEARTGEGTQYSDRAPAAAH